MPSRLSGFAVPEPGRSLDPVKTIPWQVNGNTTGWLAPTRQSWRA